MLLDRLIFPAALALLPGSALAELAVDIELVLAVDISGSVDASEQELERTGLVQAFKDRGVIEAIHALPLGLAVAVVAFAGAGQTRTVVGWRRLTDRQTIDDLAERIAAAFPFEFAFAVGTLIAERPPHRSVRAGFPHTAPTLGV